MGEITFIVYNEKIDKSLDEIYFSETLTFNIKKYDGDELVAEDNSNLVDIKRGISKIPLSDYTLVENTIIQFLDDHNEGLASHSIDVRFEITDIDSRGACEYKEYFNGELIKEGRGWAKDFEMSAERDAWDEAVIKYKKENNIKTPSDIMKESIAEIKESISKLNIELPQIKIELLVPPLIETALPTLSTDPCNFINEITKAANIAISRINGLPSPKEILNFEIKMGKNQAAAQSTSEANEQEGSVNSEFSILPVTTNFDDMIEYMNELDAEREEYIRTHPEEIMTFECVEPVEPVLQDENFQALLSSGGTLSVNGGTRNEVLRSLGFTGTDSKEYCDSKIAWGVKVKTLRGTKKVSIHKALVDEVISIFNDICSIGFDVYLIGGYCYRTINNPSKPNAKDLSMHSFGCAIDINYDINSFKKGQKRPFEYPPDYWNGTRYDPNKCIWTNDHPVVQIFKKYEWGWGGRYGDFMHFSKPNGS